MKGVRVVRTVLAERNLRLLTFGFLTYSVAEHATWLAIMVFAYQQGGVAEAGLAAVIQLVPSAVFAPLVGVLGDRVPRERLLVAAFALLTISCLAVVFAMSAELAAPVVYVIATGAALAVTVGRPIISSLLPSLVDTPDELTAANVAVGFTETLGLFLGPALAGVVLTRSDPAMVFAVMGSATAVGALAMLGVRPRLEAASDLDDQEGFRMSELLGGVRLLRAEPSAGLLVVLMSLGIAADGALDVAFAGIAVELLDSSEAQAGLLAAALGVGSLLGASGSLALVGRRRLSVPFAAGLATAGVGYALVAFGTSTPLVCLLLALGGAGSAALDLTGRTLLQGLSPEDLLARIFGLLEGVSMLGLAIGGAALSALTAWLGLQAALAVLGSALVVAAASSWRRLRAIDASRPEVNAELLSLVRSNPLFSPLPVFTIEQILGRMNREVFGPNDIVIRQGEQGDVAHLLAEGEAIVRVDGEFVRTATVGDCVGEIALLRNAKRNATITAGVDGLVTYTLDAEVFLEAVTGYPRSLARATNQAERRSR